MFDVILAGLDGSTSSRHAVNWAAAEATERHARLELVSCYEVPWVGQPPVTVGHVQEIEEGTEAELEAAVAELRAAHPDLTVTGGAFPGRPRHVLSDGGQRADLVVVGSGAEGPERHLRTGATARFVSRHSAAPVVVVPAVVDQHLVERVIVGVDGDAADGPALRWAADDAQRRGVELLIVHADPACGSDARQVVDAAMAAARAGRTLTVHYAIAPTDPAPALLAAASTGSIVVVGRRHSTTAGAFALSTCSRALLRRTTVPVVIVDGRR